MAAAQQVPARDATQKRRRRSIALAAMLVALVVLVYIMTLAHGPTILNRPL